MAWDPVWEEIFESGDWGRYPPEELIRFVARSFFAAQKREDVRLLELGCGTGANIWFLSREGFRAYGLDGARTAIDRARNRLGVEGLTADLQVGDAIAIDELYESNSFDGIIDVSSLQCNRHHAIKSIVNQAFELLKPGGKIFSIMLAAGSWGDGLGTEVEPRTYVDISEGPMKGRGLNYFPTSADVQDLFQRFSDLRVEYATRSFDHQQRFHKNWVIEGTKVT